jgi:hypothetical protein
MKRILILLMVHCITIGMEDQQILNDATMPALNDPEPEANLALWRAVKESNHAAVLSALRNNQDQNYLWPASTEDQHGEYADLTLPIYSLKILCKKNRWQLASKIVTAITWDIGNAAMKYTMSSYAAQYPVLNYVDPIRQSHTATLLFGSEGHESSAVNIYNPAKRIARDLLIKENTNLTLERIAKWQGNPVTVQTYLGNMLQSWNPLTKKDGQDLSIELGDVLREREHISQGYDGGSMTRDANQVTMMGFGSNNNRRQLRRGVLVFNDGFSMDN